MVCHNAIMVQVTDTTQSYDLNLHPVPHDVTVSCERYTVGFPVCYGSQKAREWTVVTCHVACPDLLRL
jgi:hypothetical protein